MIVDGVDIKNYGAVLIEKIIQPASIEPTYIWNNKALLPLYLSNKFTFNVIEFQLYFKGIDEEDLKTKISNFINKITQSTIQFEDGFYYTGFLEGTPQIVNTLKKETKKVTIKFLAYSHKKEVIENINRITTKTINVLGNQATPCIVEIIPISDIIDITLEGLADDPIIIKNLKANKKVIVDGEGQKVTVDGINKYGDTDMWDFPRLIPGANILKFSKNSCDIKILYKPRFI